MLLIGVRDDRAACVVETLPGRASSRGRPLTLIRRTDAPTGAFARFPPSGSRSAASRGQTPDGVACLERPPCDRHLLQHARRARSPRRRPRGRRQDHRVPDPGRHAARHARRTRRARPRQDRLGQDHRVRAAHGGAPRHVARRRQAPPGPTARPRARSDARARHADHADVRAVRGGLRPHDHDDLRRHQPDPPGRRAARRRRHRRGHPRPPRRPHEAGLPAPRRDRDHRARRGRPHGRPRLPAGRHAHHGQDARRAASACCSRRRSTTAWTSS